METVNELLRKLASNGVKLSAHAGQLSCYAQKGALTQELRDGIVRLKPELIAFLQAEDVTPVEFPLSAGQKGLYILQKMNPGMSAYNVPLCFRINADIDPAVLAEAWDRVLDELPILTARVIERDGALYQRVDASCRTSLQHQTLALGDAQLLPFLQSRAKQPFDLERGPLTRIELFARANEKPVLLLTVHHIIIDGASAVLVLKALLDCYQQLIEGISPRPVQPLPGYQKFVAWEEAMLASSEGAAHARYWQQQLDGELPLFELLPGTQRPQQTTFSGDTLVTDLPQDLGAWARDFSKAHAVPPSVIFLAAFQLLLHRYSNQDDVIVGMPVMGRPSQEFATEVGYFINMVPLRVHCGAPLTVKQFMRKVQGTMLDALYHSSFPFPLIVEGLRSTRRDNAPIFRVSYAYQNFVNPADFMSMLQQELFQLENVPGIWQEGDFELGLEIYEAQGSAFSVHLKYNPDLYSRETIEALYRHYAVLLRGFGASPDLAVHELPMLTEQEQQQLAASRLFEQGRAYWQQKLSGLPERLELPADHPRTSSDPVAGSYTFDLDADVSAQLEAVAQHKGASLFMILLAAFKVLLHRYTGESDICVVTAGGGRLLPLRSRIEPEDTFSALLSQVKKTCDEAYAHQAAAPEAAGDFPALLMTQEAPAPLRSALCLRLTDAARYTPQTIARLGVHFTSLCRAIAARPTTKIRALECVTEVEKQQLLVGFNSTDTDYPRDRSIHQLFSAQAAAAPSRTVVTVAGHPLSYQALADKSGELALYLQALGVTAESVVAVCVEPSFDLAIGALGVVRAGGTYLPLDPADAEEQLTYVLQDSQAAVVLTQESCRYKLAPLLAPNAKLVVLDRQWGEIVRRAAALKTQGVLLRDDASAASACYVVYPAAAEGKPKGVVVEHRALVNRVSSMQRRHPLDAHDVLLQHASHASHTAVGELFWPLTAGASVTIASSAPLAGVLTDSKATAVHFTPSLLRTFLAETGDTFETVRRVFCTGAGLDRASAERCRATFPKAVLHQVYGPAEAAIDATSYDCSTLDRAVIPIGRPVDNTRIYILDRGSRPQPVGVAGELHVSGDGLPRGYLNRARLTQEKWVPNPFVPGTRMYKTGDRGRWLDDGNIEYLGQVKL
ncbi:MAG TPA: condensation domain-containing protein [Thermoanaerobaculia bacterium]|jgi:amino acid adenylation domain-containing protein